ncbi:MAG: SGNH/GDSL hydrolase family protein [Clostridiaceae bacterium]|nr:SGNH/GDSL hydrolase family protein [Clostridiaceae bacterium]
MPAITGIEIWGDSIMRGVIFDAASSKYRFLADSAVKLFENTFAVRIKNNARFGCTADRAKPLIEKALMDTYDHHHVLLEFGGNDCDFDWKSVSRNPEVDHQPNMTLEDFERTLTEMVTSIKLSGKKPVMMTLPPIDSERYFDFICRIEGVVAENILAFLKEKNQIYRQQERYSDRVKKVAYQENVPLVDVRDAFLQHRNVSDFLCEDGIHPNEAGQKVIHQTFVRYCEENDIETAIN